ncbi:MAG TPA: hypothetical protein VGE93_05600 [Bryobacteraceae bacterium]
MKAKLLAVFLLASSSIFADWRVGIGVGVGPVYPPGPVYEAGPPVYVAPAPYGYVSPYTYVAPYPYFRSYWGSDRYYNRWHDRRWDCDPYRDYDRHRHHDRGWDHDPDRHGRW